MKLKSNALYFEINPGRNRPIGYIRNSYRENGKVCHQTISKIHGLSLSQLQNMKAAFDGKSIASDDIVITGGKEYGACATLYALAKKIGLDKIIYSKNEPWVSSVLAMIIGRIVYQGSKLALSRVNDISYLWEVCGINESEIDVNKHCYDAMDNLLSGQQRIQKRLANKHFADGTVVLYDITSSYFEGKYNDSEMVSFGYNRDKKRGKKQIVIGLICTKEGCPIAVEVYSGNTSDKTTVIDKIDELKNVYGIKDFVFVGDRGMLTQKNISERPDMLNITALTHSRIKKLCEHEDVQFSLFDEEIGTEIVLPEEPNIRYILRRNPTLKDESQRTRMILIDKTESELDKIAIPKKKADDKTLAVRAAKIFLKYKTEKYFSWTVENNKIVYSRKDSVINEQEQYDGLYVMKTNVSKEMMDKREIVEAYKSLINVEMAFSNMKTVQLEMRPIYHKTQDRIKAHVFICMLSYYLLWHMNTALKDLYKENSKKYTHSYVIEVLKSQQKFLLKVGKIDMPSYSVATPTSIQQKIQKMILGGKVVA
jgi:transposase